MNSTVLSEGLPGSPRSRLVSLAVFGGLLLAALFYVGSQLGHDLTDAPASPAFEYVLLGVALLIALGFEFVNGFHDTANAVATVIYTRSLPANFAVVWSGGWNFVGVLISSGAVAYAVLQLLPISLVLNAGSSVGFAMVFALLLAAIVWNLGTWYLGLPSSSSHTLIGSIIGVGLMNQMMQAGDANAAVDWSQAWSVGKSLLLSPLVGFALAFGLLMLLKALVRAPELYAEPHGDRPPPFWVRCLLILTCTGVSFAHGSNDGQKGMGLIMLILVGTVPMAYALNRAMPADQTVKFVAVAEVAQGAMQRSLPTSLPALQPAAARDSLATYVRTREFNDTVVPALASVTGSIAQQVRQHGSLARLPADAVANVRNDMYLTSEAIRHLDKSGAARFDADTKARVGALRQELDDATRFIPLWVKVAVAIALGLGTMIGWKRIVVTVGEKIGKTHLSYAQGASAEVVAMVTIGAADMYGLPVSTTHVLSSGVAGTMTASGSGLQMSTLRNLALAWVLTLPAAMLLSGGLYWFFTHLF